MYLRGDLWRMTLANSWFVPFSYLPQIIPCGLHCRLNHIVRVAGCRHGGLPWLTVNHVTSELCLSSNITQPLPCNRPQISLQHRSQSKKEDRILWFWFCDENKQHKETASFSKSIYLIDWRLITRRHHKFIYQHLKELSPMFLYHWLQKSV